MFKGFVFMKSKIDEFYYFYKKTRILLLQNMSGSSHETKRKEFIDRFMLQMVILWYIQEKKFFNEDKNYFLKKFKESQLSSSSYRTDNYFKFLIYFLKKLNDHLDETYFEDEHLGKIVVPRPAIFFKVEPDLKTISIPDKCFYYKRKARELSIIDNTGPPLLNFLENSGGVFNGFTLGGLYENLIAQIEKKRSGAYYTPESVTNYLCRTTIESYLLDRINTKYGTKYSSVDTILMSSDLRIITSLLNILQQIRILDPAVGTAHFLESAIIILMEIYVKIWREAKKINLKEGIKITLADETGNFRTLNLLEISDEFNFKFSITMNLILTKNVYGVDINPNVLNIAKARLFLNLIHFYNVTKDPFSNLPYFFSNLKEGNSLLGYIQAEKSQLTKQKKLDSFLLELIDSFEPIKVDYPLRKYLRKASIALNISGDLGKELEELNQVLIKREITQNEIRKILGTKRKIHQILISSLHSPFFLQIQNLLIRIESLLNVKLDGMFSSEYNIDSKKLMNVKTFHWSCGFPEIFLEDGGFDIIITNPPYLGESGNKVLFRTYAKALKEYYEGKMDLWYFFLHRSLDLMTSQAFSSMISSSYWITASGAAKLRSRLLLNTFIVRYINFGENKVFGTAQGVHTNIIILKKKKEPNNSISCALYEKTYPRGSDLIQKLADQHIFEAAQSKLIIEGWDHYFHFFPKKIREIIENVTKNSTMLKASNFYVKEGIVTGLNKITRQQIRKFGLPNEWNGMGVFILNQQNSKDWEVIESFSYDEKMYLKPFYKNSDINKYTTNLKTFKRILYVNRTLENLNQVPKIKLHLEKFQKILEYSLDNPPYINRPRTQNIFTSPKIVTPQRSVQNTFAYNSCDWFAAQDVYYILSKNNDRKKLKSLLIILNSSFAYFWLYWMGKRKGRHLELFGEPLGYFPIPSALEGINILSSIAEYILFLRSCERKTVFLKHLINYFEEEIADSLVFEIYFMKQLDENGVIPLIEIISKKLTPIEYDQWHMLNSLEQLENELNTTDKSQKEAFELENLDIIEETYSSLIKNNNLRIRIDQIKANPLVKTIVERN